MATMTPVRRSTIGWSTATGTGSRGAGATRPETRTWSRPDRFASYSASSASRRASAGSVAGSQTATPAENV